MDTTPTFLLLLVFLQLVLNCWAVILIMRLRWQTEALIELLDFALASDPADEETRA